jgi:hypothetical protein
LFSIRGFCVSASVLLEFAACIGSCRAADTVSLELRSLRFTPEAIETSRGPAEVTISFAATDDSSELNYFEAVFTDPSGVVRRSASAKLTQNRALEDSVRIAFPRFSNAGTWTLSHVFLSDSSGNTLSLNTEALIRAGVPTVLEVVSSKDTISPQLVALDFTPTDIDTSAGPALVSVNFTATDDLSGVSYIELSFVSPSGAVSNRASAKFEPRQSIATSVTVPFPRFSEPGRWLLSTVFLTDAAGNTLLLDAKAIVDRGLRTGVDLRSETDIRIPELTSLRFAPDVIDTVQGDATVTIEFEAKDDLSGVMSIEATFVGPSNSLSYRGSTEFSPPMTEVNGSMKVIFPKGSEQGVWSLSAVTVSDGAGNTLVLDRHALASKAGKKLQVQ